MSEPATISALLVDMDGTLVDTETRWYEAETAIMTSFGAHWTPADQAVLVGGPLMRALEYMSERAGGVPALEIGELLLDEMEALLDARPVEYQPGAIAIVDQANGAGIPVALVSASTRRLVDAVLRHIGDHHFETTVAGDETARTKPHPEPYLTAAARLGVDPAQAVVLEDSPTGVAAGLASGAFVVGIPHVAPVMPAPRLHLVDTLEGVSLDDIVGWATTQG
jgi:HAD superfamily hydrolase (TIGR01509 family)